MRPPGFFSATIADIFNRASNFFDSFHDNYSVIPQCCENEEKTFREKYPKELADDDRIEMGFELPQWPKVKLYFTSTNSKIIWHNQPYYLDSKKMSYTTLFYKDCGAYSVEGGGQFWMIDGDWELDIWLSGSTGKSVSVDFKRDWDKNGDDNHTTMNKLIELLNRKIINGELQNFKNRQSSETTKQLQQTALRAEEIARTKSFVVGFLDAIFECSGTVSVDDIKKSSLRYQLTIPEEQVLFGVKTQPWDDYLVFTSHRIITSEKNFWDRSGTSKQKRQRKTIWTSILYSSIRTFTVTSSSGTSFIGDGSIMLGTNLGLPINRAVPGMTLIFAKLASEVDVTAIERLLVECIIDVKDQELVSQSDQFLREIDGKTDFKTGFGGGTQPAFGMMGKLIGREGELGHTKGDEVQNSVFGQKFLLKKERIEMAFQKPVPEDKPAERDTLLFTTHRIIHFNKKSYFPIWKDFLKQFEFTSIPYHAISHFAVQTAKSGRGLRSDSWFSGPVGDTDVEVYLFTDATYWVHSPIKEDPKTEEPPNPGYTWFEFSLAREKVDLFMIQRYLSVKVLGIGIENGLYQGYKKDMVQSVSNAVQGKNSVFNNVNGDGGPGSGNTNILVESSGLKLPESGAQQKVEGFLSQAGNWLGDNACAVLSQGVQKLLNEMDVETSVGGKSSALLPNENVIYALQSGRDMIVFTPFRVIYLDVRGALLTRCYYLASLPYQSHTGFSAKLSFNTLLDENAIYMGLRSTWPVDSGSMFIAPKDEDIFGAGNFATDIRNHGTDTLGLFRFMTAIEIGMRLGSNMISDSYSLASSEPGSESGAVLSGKGNPNSHEILWFEEFFDVNNMRQITKDHADYPKLLERIKNERLLVDNETVEMAFVLRLDFVLFTNIRLFRVRHAFDPIAAWLLPMASFATSQKGKSMYSTFWSEMVGFEYTTAGGWGILGDIDAELFFYVRGDHGCYTTTIDLKNGKVDVPGVLSWLSRKVGSFGMNLGSKNDKEITGADIVKTGETPTKSEKSENVDDTSEITAATGEGGGLGPTNDSTNDHTKKKKKKSQSLKSNDSDKDSQGSESDVGPKSKGKKKKKKKTSDKDGSESESESDSSDSNSRSKSEKKGAQSGKNSKKVKNDHDDSTGDDDDDGEDDYEYHQQKKKKKKKGCC